MAAPPWLISACSALGTHEAAGSADNPDVVAMHAALDGSPVADAVPWCSSFAAWSLARAGLAVPSGVTRLARSWLRAGGMDQLAHPCHGAVAVLRRGSHPWQGHVGFVVGANRGLLCLLGGNQGDQVTVAPYAADLLLGLRWPRGSWVPGPPLG